MKLKIEMEIDWINGEDLDDDIKHQVIAEVSKQIIAGIEKDTVKKLTSQVEKALDTQILKTYDEFMNKSFDVRDSWGDMKKEGVNVKELLKEKLDVFMSAKVNKDGEDGRGYGELRYKHILDRESKKQIDAFISAISEDVIKGIKSDINEEAQKRISEAILSDYSLKKLIPNIG